MKRTRRSQRRWLPASADTRCPRSGSCLGVGPATWSEMPQSLCLLRPRDAQGHLSCSGGRGPPEKRCGVTHWNSALWHVQTLKCCGPCIEGKRLLGQQNRSERSEGATSHTSEVPLCTPPAPRGPWALCLHPVSVCPVSCSHLHQKWGRYNLDHKALPTSPIPSFCYVNCKVPEGREFFKKRPDTVTLVSWLTHHSDGGPSVALQNKSPPWCLRAPPCLICGRILSVFSFFPSILSAVVMHWPSHMCTLTIFIVLNSHFNVIKICKNCTYCKFCSFHLSKSVCRSNFPSHLLPEKLKISCRVGLLIMNSSVFICQKKILFCLSLGTKIHISSFSLFHLWPWFTLLT